MSLVATLVNLYNPYLYFGKLSLYVQFQSSVDGTHPYYCVGSGPFSPSSPTIIIVVRVAVLMTRRIRRIRIIRIRQIRIIIRTVIWDAD